MWFHAKNRKKNQSHLFYYVNSAPYLRNDQNSAKRKTDHLIAICSNVFMGMAYRVLFKLFLPIFSTKKKNDGQPIRDSAPWNSQPKLTLVSKRERKSPTLRCHKKHISHKWYIFFWHLIVLLTDRILSTSTDRRRETKTGSKLPRSQISLKRHLFPYVYQSFHLLWPIPISFFVSE